jgi:hypothetical protein
VARILRIRAARVSELLALKQKADNFVAPIKTDHRLDKALERSQALLPTETQHEVQ